jgi:ABC-type thiamin/hydroxymethylpyrimidine transport system permease subunit
VGRYTFLIIFQLGYGVVIDEIISLCVPIFAITMFKSKSLPTATLVGLEDALGSIM